MWDSRPPVFRAGGRFLGVDMDVSGSRFTRVRPSVLTAWFAKRRTLASGQVERQALERHGQIDALELHVERHPQSTRRKIEQRLDASLDNRIRYKLRRRGRYRDDRDRDPFPAGHPFQLPDIVNPHTAPRPVPDFDTQAVEERHDAEPLLTKAGIVGQGETQVAGADDRDPEWA